MNHIVRAGMLLATAAVTAATATPAYAVDTYAPHAQAGGVIDAEGRIIHAKKIVGVTKPYGYVYCVEFPPDIDLARSLVTATAHLQTVNVSADPAKHRFCNEKAGTVTVTLTQGAAAATSAFTIVVH